MLMAFWGGRGWVGPDSSMNAWSDERGEDEEEEEEWKRWWV